MKLLVWKIFNLEIVKEQTPIFLVCSLKNNQLPIMKVFKEIKSIIILTFYRLLFIFQSYT